MIYSLLIHVLKIFQLNKFPNNDGQDEDCVRFGLTFSDHSVSVHHSDDVSRSFNSSKCL